MNEKQRLEQTGQIQTADHPTDKKSALDALKKKTSKDYEKYFTSVFIPPNLKEAKKRGKQSVRRDRPLKAAQAKQSGFASWRMRLHVARRIGRQ